MLTIDEIEAACDVGKPLDFSRHALEAPELTLCERFHPLGFAIELRTNSLAILSLARELWSVFEPRPQPIQRPIRVDVHVVDAPMVGSDEDGAKEECPPAPSVRFLMPLIVTVADAHNFSVGNLEEGWTRVVVARGTESHRNYLGYFFLGAAPLCHIASAHATPIHAGCVAWKGRGILLCGDSGAGKSSLSYACARAGWTYVTDDASYLLHDGKGLTITGNCHQVRFRPTAGQLFPEVEGLEITPRAAGKPSIEMPTASLPWMSRAATAHIDSLVFLNRRVASPPALAPYCKEVARSFLRQVLFGPVQSLAVQYRNLDRLLNAEVLELRYNDLDWAVQRLRALAEEGR
jgi:hypothetical protein